MIKLEDTSVVAGKVKVWTTPDKGTRVTLPATWAPTSMPAELYVEGCALSTEMRDVTLKLSYIVGGTEERASDTVKAAVVSIGLKQVSFSGTYYHAVRQDDDSGDYSAPQWQDNTVPLDGDADDVAPDPPSLRQPTSDRKWPICYERAKKLLCSVIMKIAPSCFWGEHPQIKGDGPGDLDFDPTSANVTGEEAEADNMGSGGAYDPNNPHKGELPDHVYQYPFASPLYINWYISHDNGVSWFGPFASGNETFVTLGNPLGDPNANPPVPGCTTPFRTVLYLATKDSTATTESQCVTDTWARFSGLDVKRWQDASKAYDWPLFYYASRSELPPANPNDPDIPPSNNTAGLLASRNGDCTGWANFLSQCLLANNVSNDVAQAGPSPWLARPSGGTIAVKDIRFTGTRYTSDGGDRECWTGVDDHDEYGILYPNKKGQGEGGHTPAARVFNWHKVVKVGSTYYDSSYGGQPFADSEAAKSDYTRANIGAGWQQVWVDGDGQQTLWCEVQKADGTLWDGPISIAP